MKANRAFRNPGYLDDDAAISLEGLGIAGIVTGVIAIIVVIIGATLGMNVLSGLAPSFIGAGANLTENVTTQDFGNETVNSVAQQMGIVVAVLVLFALVSLILFALSKVYDK